MDISHLSQSKWEPAKNEKNTNFEPIQHEENGYC